MSLALKPVIFIVILSEEVIEQLMERDPRV